jgi:hypothetical protein
VRHVVEGNLDRRTAFWILHSFVRLLCDAVSVTVIMYSDNNVIKVNGGCEGTVK